HDEQIIVDPQTDASGASQARVETREHQLVVAPGEQPADDEHQREQEDQIDFRNEENRTEQEAFGVERALLPEDAKQHRAEPDGKGEEDAYDGIAGEGGLFADVNNGGADGGPEHHHD